MDGATATRRTDGSPMRSAGTAQTRSGGVGFDGQLLPSCDWTERSRGGERRQPDGWSWTCCCFCYDRATKNKWGSWCLEQHAASH